MAPADDDQIGTYRAADVIAAGATHVLRRAYAPDGTPVVLKLLREDKATGYARARLEREYELLELARGERVVGARELLSYRNTLVLAMEDFGAQSLAELLDGDDVPTFDGSLHIAIEAAHALAHLHELGVIHHDV